MKNQIRKQARRGAVAVEFALTAPLLFMMLFAALELGHANMVFNVAEAAAFEGAREAILPGATAGEASAAAQRLLGISRVRGASISVNPSNLAIDSDTVTVSISIPYSQNTVVPPFFTRGIVINRSCQLTREDAS